MDSSDAAIFATTFLPVLIGATSYLLAWRSQQQGESGKGAKFMVVAFTFSLIQCIAALGRLMKKSSQGSADYKFAKWGMWAASVMLVLSLVQAARVFKLSSLLPSKKLV